MKAILDYFAQSPEAVAALLLAATGLLLSIVGLLYQLYRDKRVVVRHLGSYALISIDKALQEYVDVNFRSKDGTIHVKSLRQLDYDIYNNNYRSESREQTVSIKFPRHIQVKILGVTAANSNGLVPKNGGKRLTATVEHASSTPMNPLLPDGSTSQGASPVIVVSIPPLDRAVNGDRPLLRITYDGLPGKPEILNAQSEDVVNYRLGQLYSLLLLVMVLLGITLFLIGVAYRSADIDAMFQTFRTGFPALSIVMSPPYLWAMVCALLAIAVMSLWIVYEEQFRRYIWPITRLTAPRPFSESEISSLDFYDALEEPPHLRF